MPKTTRPTRRQLIQAAGVAAFGTAAAMVDAQTRKPKTTTQVADNPGGNPPAELSDAVVMFALHSARTLRQRDGRATGEHIRNAALSLGVLAAHMEEAGISQQLQGWLPDPGSVTVADLQQRLAAIVPPQDAVIRQEWGSSLLELQSWLATVDDQTLQEGVRQAQANGIRWVFLNANRILQRQAISRDNLHGLQAAALVRVQDPLPDDNSPDGKPGAGAGNDDATKRQINVVAGTMGILGAMWGLGGWVAVAGGAVCLPCGAAAITLGMLGAGIALWNNNR